MDTNHMLVGPTGRPLVLKVATRPSEGSPARVRCEFFVQLSAPEVRAFIRIAADVVGDELPIDALDMIAEDKEINASICDFRLEMN